MHATTFDSLAAARKLKAVGVEESQAEVIAAAIREGSATDREDLATKADLVALEARIEARLKSIESRFESLESRMKADNASVVNRITFTMLVAIGVLFAALKLL